MTDQKTYFQVDGEVEYDVLLPGGKMTRYPVALLVANILGRIR